MTFKERYIIFILIMCLVFLPGCEGIEEKDKGQVANVNNTTELKPIENGQVIIPLTNFNTMNPLLTTNLNYHYFSKLIFEGLFDYDTRLNVEPKLVESYFFFNEGKSISIKLRDDVLWHDGIELSTDDILFTIDVLKQSSGESTYKRIIDKNLNPFTPSNLNTVLNAKKVDEKILEITFDRAYLNNLEVLTFPIIPKHRFSQNKNSITSALILEDYIPIGTGPYKYESYEKYKSITLVRNTNYRKGSPSIEKIVGKVLEDDELIVTAFETGQINFASTIAMDWDKYKQNDRIKVLEYISNSSEFLAYNFNNQIFQGESGQAIRKAISYGVNRQDIIHKVFLGHATQIDVPIHPNMYLISDNAHSYGYNREMAIELLNEAGFYDLNGDGILEDEDGKKLSLRLITNSNNKSRILASELIKEHLYDIGIDITLDFNTQYIKEHDRLEEEAIWEGFNNKLNRGDYDIALLGWQTSVIPNLYSLYHSSMIQGGSNFIAYSDEIMDQLLIDSLLDKSREEKIGIYEKIQEKIAGDLPYSTLFFINKGLLVDTRIKGELSPTFFNIYNGIENCYLE